MSHPGPQLPGPCSVVMKPSARLWTDSTASVPTEARPQFVGRQSVLLPGGGGVVEWEWGWRENHSVGVSPGDPK